MKYLNKDATDNALDELLRRGPGAKMDEWMKDSLDNDAADGALAEKLVHEVYAASLRFKEVNERMNELNDRGQSDAAHALFQSEWMPLHRAQSSRELRLTGMGITSAQIMEYFNEHEPTHYGNELDEFDEFED
jgi:hypothetical protein